MKAGRMTSSFVLLVLGICLFLGLSSVSQASDYFGTYCWQSSLDGTIYEFAITDMGDSHYLLNGKAIVTGGSIYPISGNGEIGRQAGNTAFYIAFNGGSFGQSGTETFSINWALNSSLNGTGAGTMIGTNYQNESARALIHDTLNFIACP